MGTVVMLIWSLVIVYTLVKTTHSVFTKSFETRKQTLEKVLADAKQQGVHNSVSGLLVVNAFISVIYWMVLATHFSGILALLACVLIIATIYGAHQNNKIMNGEEFTFSLLPYFTNPLALLLVICYIISILF